MTNVKIFISVIVVLILGVIATVLLRAGESGAPAESGKYDAFVQCLKAKGATFFGAFWCPHCQAQKKLFGGSAKLLPYVECSTADGSAQTQVCLDKKIASYPTWEFADLSRLTGEVPLADLAKKTACLLPDGEANTPIQAGASSTAK